MTIQQVYQHIFRPKILVRAARIGMQKYVRDKDLKRLLKVNRLPVEGGAKEDLMIRESALEAARISGAASYSIIEHISVLTALLAEMNLLPKQQHNAAV
ncbi:hypothetical protein GCM10008927_04250 [Amylibacter ulvae]|uniref:Uncharacterized protein n=1 Tax=Paramylibacter ulvae TaxID=1651968 RepID=A0ABQ3CT70_9RHOB|nr:DUF6477 family protein [Amylibacter ulvae]GHA42869.1 hypothetical protein GCM10008927_04250 [Amylibacter ulvae]